MPFGTVSVKPAWAFGARSAVRAIAKQVKMSHVVPPIQTFPLKGGRDSRVRLPLGAGPRCFFISPSPKRSEGGDGGG
jgi:hypothetical protein